MMMVTLRAIIMHQKWQRHYYSTVLFMIMSGGIDSGGNLLSSEEGSSLSSNIVEFLLLFMMAIGRHNINSDALNLLFLAWQAASAGRMVVGEGRRQLIWCPMVLSYEK